MGRSVDVPGLTHGPAPIPQAARVGPLLASGGISGWDRSAGMLPEGLDGQVREVFTNLAAVLEAGGAKSTDIVKLTFHVIDRSARPAIDASWIEAFPDPVDRPARHLVVSDLPPGLLVQAEVLAYVVASSENR